jgi:hypothetical protein
VIASLENQNSLALFSISQSGQDLSDRPLAGEKDFEAYQRLAVKQPTTNIISQFQGVKKVQKALAFAMA